MPSQIKKSGFTSLGLSASSIAALTGLGIKTPSPIQAAAIPIALTGRDLIGIAQTGTGKTLAFSLPIRELLGPRDVALILAPTRELAIQIQETLHKLRFRTALLIGGAPMGRQVSQIKARPEVIVATPGRLLDHLEQMTVDLRRVQIAVLDEADRMLDMGFAPAIRKILDKTPTQRQTMMFSATMPASIGKLAADYLRKPETVEVARPGTPVEAITQELHMVPKSDKPNVLSSILSTRSGSILVFARTRHGARKIARSIRDQGHTAAEIHSDRTLAQRRAALEGFKTGTYRILVATDIAARGIDVKDISLVVNYDIPENPEDYLHRIGRTGRAGSTGHAITLATSEQKKDIRNIEKLLQRAIPLAGEVKSEATPHRERKPAHPVAQFPRHNRKDRRPKRAAFR